MMIARHFTMMLIAKLGLTPGKWTRRGLGPQFFERKRKEGKRHNAAVVALACRRINVLYAMMRNHEYYRDPAPAKEAAAA